MIVESIICIFINVLKIIYPTCPSHETFIFHIQLVHDAPVLPIHITAISCYLSHSSPSLLGKLSFFLSSPFISYRPSTCKKMHYHFVCPRCLNPTKHSCTQLKADSDLKHNNTNYNFLLARLLLSSTLRDTVLKQCHVKHRN